MWGNGAATARVLARSGAKIFGCDINIEAAVHTQKRLEVEGADVTVMAADVTNKDSVKKMVDACIAKYGHIDVLVKYVIAREHLLPFFPVQQNILTSLFSAMSVDQSQEVRRRWKSAFGMLKPILI